MKRIFICGAAVALIGVATLNVALSKKSETKFSDLSLANVEALATPEELPEVVIECDADCDGRGKCWEKNDAWENDHELSRCVRGEYTWLSCDCS
jgi:hypothetical protein